MCVCVCPRAFCSVGQAARRRELRKMCRASQRLGIGRDTPRLPRPGAPPSLLRLEPCFFVPHSVMRLWLCYVPTRIPESSLIFLSCAGCLRGLPRTPLSPKCRLCSCSTRWGGDMWSRILPLRGTEPCVPRSKRLKERSEVRPPAGPSPLPNPPCFQGRFFLL